MIEHNFCEDDPRRYSRGRYISEIKSFERVLGTLLLTQDYDLYHNKFKHKHYNGITITSFPIKTDTDGFEYICANFEDLKKNITQEDARLFQFNVMKVGGQQ